MKICSGYGYVVLATVMLVLNMRAASAANNVVSPYVDPSVLSLNWRSDVTTDNRSKTQDGAWKQKLTIGYGFTDRLYLAIGGIDERTGGQTASLDGLELLAKYQLTPKGLYWLDSGVLIDYKKNIDGGPNNVAAKLLLAKNTGNFLHEFNIIAQRDMGDDASRTIDTGLSWSSRYLYSPALQPGFEVHSEFGTIQKTLSFTSNSNQAGPVLYGKLPGGFNYEVGYLFGLSRAAPDGDVKAQVGYEFKF